MAWHLYTWGDKVEVLEPAKLAEMMNGNPKGVAGPAVTPCYRDWVGELFQGAAVALTSRRMSATPIAVTPSFSGYRSVPG